MSVIDKILEHGVNQADKVAVYDGDLGISYLEFVDQIKAVALNLRYETIRSGDVLLLASSNSYSFICLYFAAHTTEMQVANLSSNHPLLIPRLDTNDLPKSQGGSTNKWYIN